MQRSTEKLYKILKLESDFNYNNKAVVGGLEKLTEMWQGEARADSLPEEQIQEIISILNHYSNQTSVERSQAVKRIGYILDNPGIKHLAEPQIEKQASDAKEFRQSHVTQPDNRPKQPRSSRVSTQKRSGSPIHVNSSIISEGLTAPTTVVRGIGGKQAQLLSKLGLHTIEDMIYYFPRRYDDYSELKLIKDLSYGEEVTIIAWLKASLLFLLETKTGRSSKRLSRMIPARSS